jgi:AcrR family transcriptional regulator
MIDFSAHENAERILADGWELFQQKGYLGVSLDEICLRCGISKPTLYYYFKNKENLFVEILVRRLLGFRDVIEQAGSLEERLTRIAIAMFDSFKTDYSYLVRDLTHIKHAENVARIRSAFDTELFIPITRLMQSALDDGLLSGDARFLAHLYMGIVENYIARADDFGLDHAALAEQLVAFYLKGAGR